MANKKNYRLDEAEPIEYPKGTLAWVEHINNIQSSPYSSAPASSAPSTSTSKKKKTIKRSSNHYKPSRTTANFVQAEDDFNSYYTVNKGDSLWKISKETGIPISRIRELNPEIKGDMIYPNQILKVAEADSSAQPANSREITAQPVATPSDTNSYQMPANDTLYRAPINDSLYRAPINDTLYRSSISPDTLDYYANKYPITPNNTPIQAAPSWLDYIIMNGRGYQRPSQPAYEIVGNPRRRKVLKP